MTIAENLERIKANIDNIEQKYNRAAGSVKLIAVSKRKPASAILEAINHGQMDFGENYLQEAIDKIESIKQQGIIWHFIGPIQSNKTTTIAKNFDWVHTVDRIKIARRLNDARPTHKSPLNICIQINISNETSKSGIKLTDADSFVKALGEFKQLNIRGLMALPAPEQDFEKQRQPFAELQSLMIRLQKFAPSIDTLSIGTTQDMQAAIAEGATMVRIGTAIFGERD